MIPSSRSGRAGRPGDAVLITGAGSGLGRDAALALAAAGFDVYATIRNPGQRADLEAAAAGQGAALTVLELDLTDPVSIRAAVEAVVARAGTIYALVNNAGIGLRGALEDCTMDEIRAVYDANVIGTIEVTKAVIPHLRAAGRGRIVTITSIGGRVPGFGVTTYCSSKFAQEGVAEGLAIELAPFGIQSIIIEPGMINTTRWSTYRGTAAGAEDPGSPYHAIFWASEEAADRIVRRSPTRPEHVAQAIVGALTAERPRMRYVVGRGAAIVIALRRHLPPGVFERLYYGGQLRRLERKAPLPPPVPEPAPPVETRV